MKVIRKYFLALVPPPEIFERAHEIKIALRDQFGIKYALKSPPHITVKMPFNYNEAKEDQLVASLKDQLKNQEALQVRITGVGKFGKRVIFLDIQRSEKLLQLQHDVSKFCKVRIHLTEELSDRNYHPHLTVAFKDVKESHFSEAFDFVSSRGFLSEFSVAELTLLKRNNQVWDFRRTIPFLNPILG